MTNDNERIDDLQRNGYRIIQNKDCFCFGMDAVLLSSFAKAQKNEQVLDLGTGNGVIPILMQAKKSRCRRIYRTGNSGGQCGPCQKKRGTKRNRRSCKNCTG